MKKVFILMIVMVFASCSDGETLNTVRQNAITDVGAFETPTRALQQVLGMYAGVKDGRFYGGRYFVYNDAKGEEFINETLNPVTNSNTWFFNVNSTTNEVQNLWLASYAAINRCNTVIKGIETSPISNSLKTQYKAEALFLRALCNYALVTTYARPYWDSNGAKEGIPLRLVAIATPGQSNLVRSTVGEVYAQIIKDLNDAEAGLLVTNGNAYDNSTRAHKNTAIALKTRVYLSMRDYPNVIAEASKIAPQVVAPFSATSGVPNQLMPTIAAVFAANATTNENILSFVFNSQNLPGVQNGLGSYYNPATSLNGTGEYSLNPTGILGNTTAWVATDARRSFITVSGTKSYLSKYPRNSATAPDYVPAIRYSEVLLNLAEALVRNSNTLDARAIALLNSVHRRSDVTTTFIAANFATSTDLLNQIALERRIEFLGEGLRSIDVQRLGQPFSAKGVAQAVSVSDTQYIWPIPQNELLYNRVCTQNSGY
jgi:starch-binding outer membrane protein, SusD/RagB family